MSTPAQRETAKIYQFPLRRPNPVSARRTNEAALDRRWQATLDAECDGAWYHAAAVEDVQRGRK